MNTKASIRRRIQQLSLEQRSDLARRINKERDPGSLEAFIVLKPGVDREPGNLRAELQRVLLPHMLPGRIHVVDGIPRLPNGKPDRRSLRAKLSTRPPVTQESAWGETQEAKILLRLYQEVLGMDEIMPEDNFFEIGGDSFKSIQLVSKGRAEGLEIGPNDLIEHPVLKSLAQVVSDRKQAPRTAEPESPTIAHRAPNALARNLLVPLRPASGDQQVPFYLFHGVGGTVTGFQELALGMPPQLHPIGVQSPNIDPDIDEMLTTIPGIADVCVEAILLQNPDGPYYFMGYSLGGMLAYEITRRLEAAGKTVALIALLDTYNGLVEVNLPTPVRQWIRRLSWHVRKFYFGPRRFNHAQHLLVRCGEIFRKYVLRRNSSDYERLVERATRANYKAIRSYLPAPQDTSVLLFRATIDPLFKTPTHTMGWENLAMKGVEVVDVPSMHIDLTTCEPAIRVIADELDRRIPSPVL